MYQYHRLRLSLIVLFIALGFLSFTPNLFAQLSNAPYAWVPYLSKRLQNPIGGCVHNNLLWAWGTDTSTFGLTAFDGKNTYQGSRTIGPSVQTLHSTGSGLFTTVLAKRATVEVQSLSGAFVPGERVTQTATGATGALVLKYPQQFVLVSTGKDFNASPITGDTSHATLTPKSVVHDTSYFLERSLTGFDDFVPVMDIPYRLKVRGLVDCGRIRFSGKTTRLLLAFDDPILEGQFAHVYYNFPDIDNSWKELMVARLPNGERPIRHFHGALWVPGQKAGTGRLIAMTGDRDSESSLVVCDDVADLIQHPGNWKTRWGLDRMGDNRVQYLRTKGKPYCIGVGTQEYRVIDILFDEQGKYGYYIPDTHTLTSLMQIDLANKTAKPKGTLLAQGYGWMALRLINGMMLFSAASEAANGYYNGNADQYIHLYALKPDGSDIVEVFKTLRADYKAPTQARGNFISILEYDNAVWMLGNNVLDPVTVGWIGDKNQKTTIQNEEANNLSNVLEQLTDTDLLFGAGSFKPAELLQWYPWNATLSSDTTVIYKDRSPKNPSLLCQPSSTIAGSATATLSLNPKLVRQIRGAWLTVMAYVHTELPNETVGISVYINPTTSLQSTLKTTGGWDTITLTILVPLDAQRIALNLMPRLSGISTRKVWFSHAQMIRGALPREIPSP